MGRSGRVWVVAFTIGACTFVASPLAAQGQGKKPQSSSSGTDGGQQASGEGEEPSEEDRKVAREAYAKGQEEYAAGNYEAAEQAFERAYEAVPEPVVLLGIAKAREKRGDVQGAITALEQYLEDRPDAPDKEKRKKQLKELRQSPGTVAIDSRPTGARVSVDGEQTEHRTPASVELEAGEHTVAVSQEGFATSTRTVQVEPGREQQLTLKLQTEAPSTEEEVFGAGQGVAGAPSEAEGSEDGDDGQPSVGVWVASGVAAGGLVAGTVLGFMSLSEQSEFEDMPTEATADRGERFALFADVAFGVAAAAAITGLVLYLTGDGQPPQDQAAKPETGKRVEVDVAPTVGRDGAGLDARVRF